MRLQLQSATEKAYGAEPQVTHSTTVNREREINVHSCKQPRFFILFITAA